MTEKYDVTGKDMMELHWVGLTAISSLSNLTTGPEKWPFILKGYFDEVLAVAFYYTYHAELPGTLKIAVESEHAKRGIENTKAHLRNTIEAALDPAGYKAKQDARERELERDFVKRMEDFDRKRRFDHRRMHAEREATEKAKRDSFNSQHKPAPEGTVKELAAKYGKSLGEIRRLKAEGLLHTLEA